jgi:hypothetical protein
MDRETAELVRPFGEADCESEVKLLKEEYRSYFFYNTHFNELALDPKCFLIIGRRGSGKTALSQFFSFQERLPQAIAIDVDEPTAFEQVLEKIPALAAQNREIAVPRISKIWELVVWFIIFRELQHEDPRIRSACLFGDSQGKLSTFTRKVLNAVLNKVIQADVDLLDVVDELFGNAQVQLGQKAVLEVSRRKPVIVAIDTLENYAIDDPAMMHTIAALIQFGADFNREYARRGLHIKIFLMAEIFPYIKEEVVLNTLKSVRDPLHLHWRPKDLMRLISWRFYSYLRAMNQLDHRTAAIDWDNYNDVLEQVWYPYFGRDLPHDGLMKEACFPYILRHTQMRPRQLIVLCNTIAQQAMHDKTFPHFEPTAIVKAIQHGQNALAEEVFNSYSVVYPKVGRIVDALSGLPMIFKGNELDRRAPLTASEWPSGEYSPFAFRQLVAELGIVGRVRRKNEQAGVVEADFEYSMEGRLPLLVTDECVIHPMFYQKLNVLREGNLRVYPFPDHDGFRPLMPNHYLADFADDQTVVDRSATVNLSL